MKLHSLLLPAALALSATAFAADPAPAAPASTPASAPASAPAADTAKATAADAKAAAAAKAAAQSQAAKECASSTGTRVKKDKDQCNSNKVTVYTQEELQNTGRTDMGEALKQLDPRFQ